MLHVNIDDSGHDFADGDHSILYNRQVAPRSPCGVECILGLGLLHWDIELLCLE